MRQRQPKTQGILNLMKEIESYAKLLLLSLPNFIFTRVTAIYSSIPFAQVLTYNNDVCSTIAIHQQYSSQKQQPYSTAQTNDFLLQSMKLRVCFHPES